MAKSFEQLDFTRAEDREEFRNYSEAERKTIVDATRAYAERMAVLMQSGMASSYREAYEKLQAIDALTPDYKLIIDTDCNIFVDAGAGRTFLGNSQEGAISQDADGNTVADMTIVEENMDRILKAFDQLVVNKPLGKMS